MNHFYTAPKQDNIRVPCHFRYSDDLYTCIIENGLFINNHIEQLKPFKPHELQQSNNTVQKVYFMNCVELTKVPSGLKKIFPNFHTLIIEVSNIGTISKDDLEEYKDLKEFECSNCKLEYLPGNLFDNFNNIESIDFSANKITLIEPNILDGLNNLKYANFYDNPNYSTCYTTRQLLMHDSTLVDLKTHLYDQLIEKYKPLKDLKSSEMKLKEHNELLNDSKTTLEFRIRQYQTSERDFNNQVKQLKESNGAFRKENKNLSESNFFQKSQIQNYKTTIENLKTEVQQLLEEKQEPKQPRSDLSTEIKSFMQDETTKDFKTIIDGREFPVHKFLLAIRSPTLAEILQNNPEVENLNLVDISVEIFEIILKFLYTDELPGNNCNFLNLFAAAGKLKIQKLVGHAAGKLMNQVNSENALTILPLSVNFELKELKLKAFKLLKQKYSDIKFEDEWLENPEKLIKVVAMLKKKEEILKKFDEEFKVVTSNK